MIQSKNVLTGYCKQRLTNGGVAAYKLHNSCEVKQGLMERELCLPPVAAAMWRSPERSGAPFVCCLLFLHRVLDFHSVLLWLFIFLLFISSSFKTPPPGFFFYFFLQLFSHFYFIAIFYKSFLAFTCVLFFYNRFFCFAPPQ